MLSLIHGSMYLRLRPLSCETPLTWSYILHVGLLPDLLEFHQRTQVPKLCVIGS